MMLSISQTREETFCRSSLEIEKWISASAKDYFESKKDLKENPFLDLH
jgi:hypothetical protein